MDAKTPKPGMRFEHAHFIQGSPKAGTARPDVCTVTRVTKHTVFYWSETGMKLRADRNVFPEYVKRWIEP